MGRTLTFLGAILVLCGVLFTVGEKLSIKFSRLPGDIVYRGKNTTFYFPWASCLLVSAVGSGLFWGLSKVFGRLFGRG